MKKISSWLYREDLELSRKWWHRFLKVVFILSVISLAIYAVVSLVNSYPSIVNQWSYANTVSGKLNSSDYTDKIVSINELYNYKEIISDSELYTDGYFPNLKNKELLLPYSSPVFVADTESFCSSKLDKQIKEIAIENDIKLFSTTNPTFYTLSTNIDAFASYLNINDIRCVMVDSYNIENDDGSTSQYTFLRAVDTNKYIIYKYDNNFIGFIFNIFGIFIGLLIYIFVAVFIYNKIILYIIYGNKRQVQ
ncbi:MAG: hypothetical protein QG583_18 [Patescibacteria group bacterium]|nr:hypothetical protein [Patescibacteria group bacterium]